MGKVSKQWKTKILVIILIGVLMLISFTACSMWGKSTNSVTTEELCILLQGAIEDTGWMSASSVDELELTLSAYYADPLLSELVADAWEFIYKPTDWYGQAKLESFEIIRYYGCRQTVCAQICETDLLDGKVVYGEGIYTIEKTPEGPRITAARYNWSIEDKQ